MYFQRGTFKVGNEVKILSSYSSETVAQSRHKRDTDDISTNVTTGHDDVSTFDLGDITMYCATFNPSEQNATRYDSGIVYFCHISMHEYNLLKMS